MACLISVLINKPAADLWLPCLFPFSQFFLEAMMLPLAITLCTCRLQSVALISMQTLVHCCHFLSLCSSVLPRPDIQMKCWWVSKRPITVCCVCVCCVSSRVYPCVYLYIYIVGVYHYLFLAVACWCFCCCCCWHMLGAYHRTLSYLARLQMVLRAGFLLVIGLHAELGRNPV